MIKILTVISARPQFIKAAILGEKIRTKYQKKIKEIIVNLGQHYDYNLAGIFINELHLDNINYHLRVGSGSHGCQTGKMMMELEKVIISESPDTVLVYGDTNGTLATAILAAKLQIPLIHVEGGVRSFNKNIPEEYNRYITDHSSSIIFTPHRNAEYLLRKENIFTTDGPADINHPKVIFSGDVMYDLFLKVRKLGGNSGHKYSHFTGCIILTLHRPSNVDKDSSLRAILIQVKEIADAKGKKVVFPMHPRTRKTFDRMKQSDKANFEKVMVIMKPISYVEMNALLEVSDLVITDSGGLQKEAFYSKKPCLIVLNETPWRELLEMTNIRLVKESENFLEVYEEIKEIKGDIPNIYGDGEACSIICEKIIEYFN